MSSPDDFVLLSPITTAADGAAGGLKVDNDDGLKDYTCFEAKIHWYFCSRCGVRCFALMGEGEIRDVNVEGKVQRGWTPKKEGWVEGYENTGYLSLNAATLEPGQDGCDLKEWTEKGWIAYLDTLHEVGEDRLAQPHVGGMY